MLRNQFFLFACLGVRISKKKKEKPKNQKQRRRDQARKRKEKQREKEKNDIPAISLITKEQFTAFVKQFECKNKTLVYRRCTGCPQVQIDMKVESYTIDGNQFDLCSSCKTNKEKVPESQNNLPV